MSKADTPVDLIAQAAKKFPHRPSWDEYFMATAVLMSTRSNCERLHVGCVIVTGGARKNRLVAAGYNGYLPGTPHVSRLRDGHEQATVHAEQNAVADAARRGSSAAPPCDFTRFFKPFFLFFSRLKKNKKNEPKTAVKTAVSRFPKERMAWGPLPGVTRPA